MYNIKYNKYVIIILLIMSTTKENILSYFFAEFSFRNKLR